MDHEDKVNVYVCMCCNYQAKVNAGIYMKNLGFRKLRT
jgi:hypothetical protein